MGAGLLLEYACTYAQVLGRTDSQIWTVIASDLLKRFDDARVH